MSETGSDIGKHRRSVRLERRAYSSHGFYFVTICTQRRYCFFGSIADIRLALSALGQIARECWVAIPQHFPQVELHELVVMPNHVLGILALSTIVGAQHRGAAPHNVTPGSVGAIIRSFKAIVALRAHKELGRREPVWQRNYFERVLRDGKEFSDASSYIVENPKKWEWDRENPYFNYR